MTYPTAHQVENLAAWRKELPIKLGDGCDSPVVYVRDEPGRTVELLVGPSSVRLKASSGICGNYSPPYGCSLPAYILFRFVPAGL